MAEDLEQQKNIERYKVKKLIKYIENAKGAGTSVITIYIPPKEQLSKIVSLLNTEYGLCSNIKSHSNQLSVKSAITSALERLKLFSKVPPNGMIIYSGEVVTEDGKEKKLTMDIEPFKPVTRNMYKCDNKFHTEELHKMLESDDKFGFIIVDGSGTSYHTLCGNVREKITSFTVDLPKKHGRGGQSKNRFARIRMEKRHNYVRKVAELATSVFISNDKPNIKGLVLGGSADFKEILYGSDLLDPRLKAVVVKVVDIQHSGDVGFNQAIGQAEDILSNVKLVQEKKVIQVFFEEIARDTLMYCYGISDTIKCLEMGAVEKLILWEDSDIVRYEVYEKNEDNPSIYYMTKSQSQNAKFRTEKSVRIEEYLLVDWITDNYKKFGCSVELISDKSQEGTQFVRGFGGFGGLLRYRVNLMEMENREDKEYNIDDDDFM